MKEEIEEFKRTNGNSNFSQKDMIIYVVHKVDKIEDKISGQFIECNKNYICKGTFWKLFTISVLVLGSIFGYITTQI